MENWTIRTQDSFNRGRDESFGDGIIEPHQIMPSQAHGRPKLPCSQSVRLLMIAILEDAMRVFLSPVGSGIRRRERQRAQQWFASTDKSYIFAFERICEVLDFDAPSIRGKLRRQLNEVNERRAAALAERAVA